MNKITTQKISNNSAKQFYQKLLESSELQAQLKTASNPESLCQMAVKLGAEMGYSFTLDEANEVMATEVAMGGDVLKESDLSAISLVGKCADGK